MITINEHGCFIFALHFIAIIINVPEVEAEKKNVL